MQEHLMYFYSYQFPDAVQNKVYNFLSNGVMTTCIVIGCIFFSCYKLLRVEKLAVGASANLI